MNKLILSVIIQIIILINVNTSNCISSSEIDSLKKSVKEFIKLTFVLYTHSMDQNLKHKALPVTIS